MIRWIYTAQVAPGKLVEAMQHTKEMIEFSKKWEGVTSPQTFLQSFGEVGFIHTMADYEDLASFEKITQQALADPGYFQKLQEGKDLYVHSTIKTVVMRSF